MKCYTAPYEGDRDYIFVSYCHKDASRVYPIIERLSIEGFRVWYDSGIHPGDDWPEVIASHLEKAGVVIAVISRASVESHNCLNEVNFAVGKNKKLLCVIIEDVMLTAGVRLQLSSSQYIRMHETGDRDAFYEALLEAAALENCRSGGRRAGPADLELWRRHAEEYKRIRDSEPSPEPEEDHLLDWLDGASPSLTADTGREKKEAERRQQEAEEAERRRQEEEEAERKRLEAEEAERRQQEAEEAERRRLEAEEAERRRQEAEEAERRRLEAEEAERRRQEAEEAERKRFEEDEAERSRMWEEEAAERSRQWEEEAVQRHRQWEAEEAERRRKWEAEEAERWEKWEAEKAERRRLAEEAAERRRQEAEEAECKRREEEEAERKRREEERKKQNGSQRIQLMKKEEEARQRAGQSQDSRSAVVSTGQQDVADTSGDVDNTLIVVRDPDEGTMRIRPDDDRGGPKPMGKTIPGLLVRRSTGELFRLSSDKEQTVIGRKQKKREADVVLDGNEGISRRHAEIEKRADGYFVRDLGSKNGTNLNGNPVGTAEAAPLGDIAVINLGDEEFFFISPTAFSPVSEDGELGLLKSVRTGELRLVTGERFPLDRNHAWAGDVLGSLHISRRSQTEIIHTGGAFLAADLNSPNGTYLNGIRLADTAEKLNDGDEISVVDERFIFYEISLKKRSIPDA